MAQYDRFALAGGLDLSTPYISREPGTLLQCNNFSPDSDGGYRVRGGYERFDGQLKPSEVNLMGLYVTGDTSGYICGQTVTGSISGAVGVVGKVTPEYLWIDQQSEVDFVSGDSIGAATVDFITEELVSVSNFIPDNGEENKILVVSPTPDFQPFEGGLLRGETSGAVVQVHYVLPTTDGLWIYAYAREGELINGESIREQDGDTGTLLRDVLTVEVMLSTPYTQAGAKFFLTEKRRDKIGMVPGTSDIMGVWELNDVVYAFRDGKMFNSSPTGWQEVNLGFTVNWNNRPSTTTDDELGYGDVIVGATSGATATVGWVGYGGSQDHSSGYFTTLNVTGTFVDGEELKNQTLADIVIGDIVGVPEANVMQSSSPRGMRFVNHNFFAGTDSWSMFGATGNGPAFCYNPSRGFAPILTGREVENPFDVIVHKEYLFLAYPNASLQHSIIGSPFDWSGGLGAGEIGVGSEIRSLISSPKSLVICTEKDVQSLSGETIDDWRKDIVTSHNGIAMFSGVYQSQTFALMRSGIAAIDRTDQFGDFSDSVVSDRIRTLLRPRYDNCVCALARKDKGVYYIYFDDGFNVAMATYQGAIIGFHTFTLGNQIVKGAQNPAGNVWFYSNTGYIYQDDVGTSFDGDEKICVMRTSYANQGDPDTRKRYRRVDITFNGDVYVNVMTNFTYDKGNGDSIYSLSDNPLSSNGGRWDTSNWNRVFWDASEFPSIAADVDGVGFDISTMVYLQSRIHPDFVVEDVAFEWTARRKVR